MTKDARVRAAIDHWAPRLVANGVPMVDFQEVTAAIDRWDDWCAAWCARAAVHETLGWEAKDLGHLRTAGECLATAAVCYHFAKFLFVHDREQARRAHLSAVSCLTTALPWLDPAGTRVEIPFEGTALAGNLRRPYGIDTPPVVIMVPGLDSAKEEFTRLEADFLLRGMATLSIDGPGQGEAEGALPIRPDWETPVAAVIDWLEQRDDVDGARVGIWGVSLGGYYVARAAAFEPRILACIALGGPYDFGAGWDRLPALTREAFRARAHAGSDAAARARAKELSLAGVASGIGCSLYIVFGRNDRLIDPSDAERLAAEAAGPVTLRMIEDGNHVANNRPYRWRPQSADWMARVFEVSR